MRLGNRNPRRNCHVQAAPAARHRDLYTAVNRLMHMIRNPRAFAAHQKTIAFPKFETPQVSRPFGGQKHQTTRLVGGKRLPAVVMMHLGLFSVIQRACSQQFQRKREAAGLNHMNWGVEADAQAHQRPQIRGQIGLKRGNLDKVRQKASLTVRSWVDVEGA